MAESANNTSKASDSKTGTSPEKPEAIENTVSLPVRPTLDPDVTVIAEEFEVGVPERVKASSCSWADGPYRKTTCLVPIAPEKNTCAVE